MMSNGFEEIRINCQALLYDKRVLELNGKVKVDISISSNFNSQLWEGM